MPCIAHKSSLGRFGRSRRRCIWSGGISSRCLAVGVVWWILGPLAARFDPSPPPQALLDPPAARGGEGGGAAAAAAAAPGAGAANGTGFTAGEPNAARRGAAPAPAAIRVITGWGRMRAPWQAGAPVRDRVAALLAALDAPLLPAGGNRGLLELDPAAPAAGRPTRWPAPAPARGACAPSAAAASAPGQSPGPRAAGTPAGQECG
jgi:hypothetical protein